MKPGTVAAPKKTSRAMWIVPLSALVAAGIGTVLVATMEDPDPPTWNTDAATQPPVAKPQVVVEATPGPPPSAPVVTSVEVRELLGAAEAACRRHDLVGVHMSMRKLARSEWPEVHRRCELANFVIEDPR